MNFFLFFSRSFLSLLLFTFFYFFFFQLPPLFKRKTQIMPFLPLILMRQIHFLFFYFILCENEQSTFQYYYYHFLPQNTEWWCTNLFKFITVNLFSAIKKEAKKEKEKSTSEQKKNSSNIFIHCFSSNFQLINFRFFSRLNSRD